jgi:hypothetical protein
MKVFRAGLIPFAVFALSFVLQQPAVADVRALRPVQTLPSPPVAYDHLIQVAIDGPHILVLAFKQSNPTYAPTYAALLYRRNLSDGKWVYRRTLMTKTGFFTRTELRMKNNIAAVNLTGNFGGQVYLFEYSNGDYRPARTAEPISHPGGIAISQSSVLVGGNDCDYDGVVYQKGTDGTWGITGRLDDNAGECDTEGMDVTLNYDYALVRPRYGHLAKAWRRNGTAVDWIPAGALNVPPDTLVSDQPYALQLATAVSDNGYVFRRSGSTWTLLGAATSVDRDNDSGITFQAVYRDGVMLTMEASRGWILPRVYLESSPGHFEHVASLMTANSGTFLDVSSNTVALIARDRIEPTYEVEIFTLPTPLRAPAQIVNDFEDREVSDFTFNSGQFALATRGSDDVLAQSSSNTLAIALATDSDWSDYQRVEADIAPTFSAGDSWVGLIARYVDPDNYYFATIRADRTFGVYKRVNGMITRLIQDTYYPVSTGRVSLAVDGSDISLMIDNQYLPVVRDSSLRHGRAGLATWQARADFDDVQVAASPEYGLFDREWGPGGPDSNIDLTTVSGSWQVLHDENGFNQGLLQNDSTGNAVAYTGTPVANLEITSRLQFDGFGAPTQSAWVGLLARYVDPQNQYYVTVRSTGQIQIRKIVNGVISVLASASFTPVRYQVYELRFRVINDELKLFVDGAMVASAHDRDIASGKYGIATYRAGALWHSLSVVQP